MIDNMNFIKKIFVGQTDSSVHLQFQKFGKGEFRNRALIKAKYSAGKYTIKTSAEFANEMVRMVAEKLGEEKTKVTGVIISTSDLKGELEFENIKQFQGVKKYLIDSEIPGAKILELLKKFPKNFFALSFSVGENILKIKPKAQKSSKSNAKEDENFNPDFCKLTTKNAELGNDFVFEKPDFKSAEITHHYFIKSIEMPEELKNSKDFAKIREESKRAGKIIREAMIDGKKIITEREFVA